MEKLSKTCFVIMPITTPEECLDYYSGDIEHFTHVLEHLFLPAIKKADFLPISPIVEGTTLIHSVIIDKLIKSDLVLCDMSCLNANVFFEFGIRTALNKPICLIKDTSTKTIPFDATTINYHQYESNLSPWHLEKEIDLLSKHITNTENISNKENSLWSTFGLKIQEDNHTHFDSINKELQEIKKNLQIKNMKNNKIDPMSVFLELADYAAVYNHYINLGEFSSSRIAIYTKSNKKLSKVLTNGLKNLAMSKGYKLIIDVR